MKIYLTKKELTDLVIKCFNVPLDLREGLEVLIDDNNKNYGKWDKLKYLHDLVKNQPHHKIPSIKSLREAYPGIGLVEAKNVIEAHWDNVIQYATAKDSLVGFPDIYRR